MLCFTSNYRKNLDNEDYTDSFRNETLIWAIINKCSDKEKLGQGGNTNHHLIKTIL